MKNAEYIANQIDLKKSMLCVGLDPDIQKLPGTYLKCNYPLFEFCKDIIECTHSFAIAYKINIAFFEVHGSVGWEQLEKIISIIPPECLIIADAKRGDIGNTSKFYAEYYFNKLKADALTLNPYMGIDSLAPFLNYNEKWSIILALTSNQGSADFELIDLKSNVRLYEFVIKSFLNLNPNDNIMFVCGATHPEEFLKIRQICPNHFLLVPGIGVQGGDISKIITAGKNKQGGLLINVSRKICYPDGSGDFKTDVTRAAIYYQKEMSSYL